MTQHIIGLTGGIGMGKSTASSYLEDVHGLPVLDADILAREAVQPGSGILRTIAERYGDAVVTADGGLNRSKLADIIFQKAEERRWVEQQIHPYVRDCLIQTSQALQAEPVVVWSVPLLFEADLATQVTWVWVVYCTPEQQQRRLLRRGLSPRQIETRTETQWPIEEKLAGADLCLDNTSTPDALYRQIDRAIATLGT